MKLPEDAERISVEFTGCAVGIGDGTVRRVHQQGDQMIVLINAAVMLHALCRAGAPEQIFALFVYCHISSSILIQLLKSSHYMHFNCIQP
ncbi:hypothetical protein D3C87_2014780 [compost metagenome]